MPDDAGVPDPTTGQTTMPPAFNLSSAAIVPYGLYLLDDGVNQFLYVLHALYISIMLTCVAGLVVIQFLHFSPMSSAWKTAHS